MKAASGSDLGQGKLFFSDCPSTETSTMSICESAREMKAQANSLNVYSVLVLTIVTLLYLNYADAQGNSGFGQEGR